MPSAISAPLTTMSITRKGMKTMKPMMNAALSSLSTNAGISVVVATSSRSFGRSRSATEVSSRSSSSPVLSSMKPRSGSMPSSNAADAVLSPLR